jgi:SAM-dependent methyltransferase
MSASSDLAAYYAPWHETVHADFFDALQDWSDSAIRRRFEAFNDVGLLVGHKPYRNSCLLEIGCATGDLYRYLARFHPEFDYTGVDISSRAVARARQKFPAGRFDVVDATLQGIDRVCPDPGVVFCKDVVLHQTDPYSFLSAVLRLPSDAAVIRLRTRDRGTSVLDPALSCQRHYSGWVPYMILNVDELIDAVRGARPAGEIVVLRHYIVLGGAHGRFLPKDCYEPETGTAETSLFVRYDPPATALGGPVVRLLERVESAPDYTLWQRIRRQIRLRAPFGRVVFRN